MLEFCNKLGCTFHNPPKEEAISVAVNETVASNSSIARLAFAALKPERFVIVFSG